MFMDLLFVGLLLHKLKLSFEAGDLGMTSTFHFTSRPSCPGTALKTFAQAEAVMLGVADVQVTKLTPLFIDKWMMQWFLLIGASLDICLPCILKQEHMFFQFSID